MILIKILTIIALMTSLVGCRSVEKALICKFVDDNKIGVQQICEYSHTFSQCRCKQIDFDSFQELTRMETFPIEYCDGLAGFKVQEWGEEIGPKLRALSRMKEERCK